MEGLLSSLERKANDPRASNGKGKGRKVPLIFGGAEQFSNHLLEHSDVFFELYKGAGGGSSEDQKKDLRVLVSLLGLTVVRVPSNDSFKLVRKQQEKGGGGGGGISSSSSSGPGSAEERTDGGEALGGKKKETTTRSSSRPSFTFLHPPSTPSSFSSTASFENRFKHALGGKN